MHRIQPATIESWCGCFLMERMSRIGKAMKKRPMTHSMLNTHQDCVFRVMKNCVSSGMFAYQISMYWPKPQQPQKTEKASIHVPSMCSCSTVTTSFLQPAHRHAVIHRTRSDTQA